MEATHHYRGLFTNSVIWCFLIWNTKKQSSEYQELTFRSTIWATFYPTSNREGGHLCPAEDFLSYESSDPIIKALTTC